MRVVSLCPSLSELVFDLGLEPTAITTWCCHPEGRVDAVEKVGGTKDPKVQRIVELAPDLVLMNDEENRLEDAQALAEAGLAIHSSFPKTIPDTAEMVRSIAKALDREVAGEGIARRIEERADAAQALAKGQEPVRYAYLIWRKPYMAAGADTFVSGLLDHAGGVNVFPGGSDAASRYPNLELDDLRGLAPDAVFLPSEPFRFLARHVRELVERTGLSESSFLLVDGERLSWHASRTPSGIDYAAEVLDRIRQQA